MRRGLCFIAFCLAAFCQERVTVPFSDSSRPKTLSFASVSTGVTIKGYDGKEVLVAAGPQTVDRNRNGRRVYSVASGMTIEELDNTVKIVPSPSAHSPITVQVPFDSNIKARCVNGGEIVVEGVRGEIDAQHVNGSIRVTNVSGAVVAHTVNGKLFVELDRLSGKPMSFSTLNGNIDVILPADLKANLKMKTHNGDIYSDFAITLEGGIGRGRSDRSITGVVNGGGPEIQFTSFNGKISIRKKK